MLTVNVSLSGAFYPSTFINCRRSTENVRCDKGLDRKIWKLSKSERKIQFSSSDLRELWDDFSRIRGAESVTKNTTRTWVFLALPCASNCFSPVAQKVHLRVVWVISSSPDGDLELMLRKAHFSSVLC